ncbi:C4-dicarboxylate TRAP transporter large permease protein DctM [Nymphon striatum]|nr:C4-dicarboxylate TRAP transporter large permease protein DctM [Nymphon striatum]
MQQRSGGIIEWLIPLAFVGTVAWLVWHLPAFMLDWVPYTSESLRGQVEAIYLRADITPNMGGIFGGHIDILDMAALILTPILAFIGARTEGRAPGRCIFSPRKYTGLLTDYVLISVPLFIFMASLLERSGIAKDMYSSLNVWLSRTRGGIAIVTSIMAVIMAAMSGIIGGEVVLLGLIALPQMLRLGYNQNLAIGVICASGSLGTMIPPSIVLIIYGLITETSIKALFTASFIPGFMLASMIITYIIVRTQLHPEDAPLPEEDPNDPPRGEKRSAVHGVYVHRGRGILDLPVPACDVL